MQHIHWVKTLWLYLVKNKTEYVDNIFFVYSKMLTFTHSHTRLAAAAVGGLCDSLTMCVSFRVHDNMIKYFNSKIHQRLLYSIYYVFFSCLHTFITTLSIRQLNVKREGRERKKNKKNWAVQSRGFFFGEVRRPFLPLSSNL